MEIFFIYSNDLCIFGWRKRDLGELLHYDSMLVDAISGLDA